MEKFTIALTTEQIRSLLDSLKKHEIIIEINYTKSYTFYDLDEAKEFFDNLMKDSIINRTICYMEACGQGWRRTLQIIQREKEMLFLIDGYKQDWIYKDPKKIKERTFNYNQKKKNLHLFLADEDRFLSWVHWGYSRLGETYGK